MAPRPRTTVKREAPALCWAPRPWAPLPRLVPCLWERAALMGPISPGLELLVVRTEESQFCGQARPGSHPSKPGLSP